MRPWRSHGNEVDFIVSSADLAMLQCGRGGATEMRGDRVVMIDTNRLLQCGRGGATEMRGSTFELPVPCDSLQCGRGGATEMSGPA